MRNFHVPRGVLRAAVAVAVVATGWQLTAIAVASEPGKPRDQSPPTIRGHWTWPPETCADFAFDATTGDFTCTGFGELRGDLEGATTWTTSFRIDSTSGEVIGRQDEYFKGKFAGRRGKLHFIERYVEAYSGAPNLVAKTRIVDGSGGLDGLTGSMKMLGKRIGDTFGYNGSYSGRVHLTRHGH